MKRHWTKELQEENERLRATVEYLRLQMRLIPQSRFDKYRNASDTDSTLAYGKCAQEVDRLCRAALQNAFDIQAGTE